MERHSIQEYSHLGAMHWYLVKLPHGTNAGGENSCISAIKDFQKCIERANLKVTYRAGWKLWKYLDDLEKLIPTNTAPDDLIDSIRQTAKNLEGTLIAEGVGKVVFVVSEKRIDIDKLINDPASLLSTNVWGSMPIICAIDFVEACKAIAYELPTAGAFHLLRCLEGAILHYYLCVFKRDRLPPKDRMWGSMVQQLKDKKRDKPPNELLDTLDRIRVNFRNPTNHPEKVYDSDEVQDLFGLCVDALNRIVKSKHWVEPSDSIDKILKVRGETNSAS